MSSTADFRRYKGPEAAPSIGPLHAALTGGRRAPLGTVATASPDPSQRRSPFASTRQRMRDVPSRSGGPVTCPLLPAALAVNLSCLFVFFFFLERPGHCCRVRRRVLLLLPRLFFTACPAVKASPTNVLHIQPVPDLEWTTPTSRLPAKGAPSTIMTPKPSLMARCAHPAMLRVQTMAQAYVALHPPASFRPI